MPPIWLNNAAGSFPKAPGVAEAVQAALVTPPREPGRNSGSENETNSVDRARELISKVFHSSEPNRTILLPSATIALNAAIHGCAEGKARIITSTLEHNSVLRPAHLHSKEKGGELVLLEPDDSGKVSPNEIRRALACATSADSTTVVLCHGSNVTGAVQPVEEVATICAQEGVPFIVDAAQTAGCVPLSFSELAGRTFVAFAGHKCLLGPPGTGGLIIPDDRFDPLVVGGTGHKSESLTQPQGLPTKYEAGTPNTPGLTGLVKALEYVLEEGVDRIGEIKAAMVTQLEQELGKLENVDLRSLKMRDPRVGIVSLLHERWAPSELAHLLDESFGIETRGGLHCAPLAHRHLGTVPKGCLRISIGPFNTADEIGVLTAALGALEAQ